MASALGSDVVTQVGIVVRDIEKTRRNWAELLGVPEPPIIVTAGFEVAQTQYKGAPSDATAKLCFFNMGQVQIELIEPDGKPSAWQDYLDEHGESVQHIAVVTPSMRLLSIRFATPIKTPKWLALSSNSIPLIAA